MAGFLRKGVRPFGRGADFLTQGVKLLGKGATGLPRGVTVLGKGVTQLRHGATFLSQEVRQMPPGAMLLTQGAMQMTQGTMVLSQGVQHLGKVVRFLTKGATQMRQVAILLTQGVQHLGKRMRPMTQKVRPAAQVRSPPTNSAQHFSAGSAVADDTFGIESYAGWGAGKIFYNPPSGVNFFFFRLETHLSRPIVAVLKFSQFRRTKRRDKILDELVLRFLRQCHAQQFEFFRRFALTNIIGETKIAREADLEILDRELVKFSVVQTLHPQRDDRLDFVAFRA
jgi:hypothetical protein